MKRKSRIVFLIVVLLLGVVVFAVAYPLAAAGGVVATY